MSERYKKYLHKDHPQRCDKDDFWGQVQKTYKGKPISQEQVDMIVHAIASGLELENDDVLLDLCCGNGALTTYLFGRCQGGLGVDFSDFLIKVAQDNFVRKPGESYLEMDVVDYVATAADTGRFTKAMCYGAYQYLETAEAETCLRDLRTRFPSLRRFFIGNLPDKDRMADFFTRNRYEPGIENRANSLIGIWRTPAEFQALAARAGWVAEVRYMPKGFYGAHWRYDAVLAPA